MNLKCKIDLKRSNVRIIGIMTLRFTCRQISSIFVYVFEIQAPIDLIQTPFDEDILMKKIYEVRVWVGNHQQKFSVSGRTKLVEIFSNFFVFFCQGNRDIVSKCFRSCHDFLIF